MSSSFQPSRSFETQRKKSTLPLFVVAVSDYAGWLDSAPPSIQLWLQASGFRAKPGACALLPSEAGPAGAVVTIDNSASPWEYSGLAAALPLGSYEAEPELTPEVANALCLGWALGSYSYERYKQKKSPTSTLVWPEEADKGSVLALCEGICLARDLVNAPASDMGPEELADAAQALAKSHGARFSQIVGDALLKKNYPMVHAVGRASSRAPRLLDFVWGDPSHPKLTLVGKGVCFDTGGLDIKPAPFMKLMKKDMGGAALMLGLAHLIMTEKLPVRLRVLIPAVENSISGNAMRPLDVLSTRKGITVEVGDTDAEGRLILGDALTEADSESPDLIIDAATLTGAARVALGSAMPAVFATKTSTWQAIEVASEQTEDALWRLPLHTPYRAKLSSKVADICNITNDSYGGAIAAALFLREFVGGDRDWVHVDTMGFNLDARPGRPVGGEALGLLALGAMLRLRYPRSVPDPKQTRSTKVAARLARDRQASPKKSPAKASKSRAPERVRPPGNGPNRPGPRRAEPRRKSP